MTLDLRQGRWSIRADAGTTENIVCTFLDADTGDPVDIDTASLWLGGTATNQDDYTGADEITGDVDDNTATFALDVPTSLQPVRLRMEVDGQLATVGILSPSEIGASSGNDITVNLGSASVTIETGPLTGGGGTAEVDPTITLLALCAQLPGTWAAGPGQEVTTQIPDPRPTPILSAGGTGWRQSELREAGNLVDDGGVLVAAVSGRDVSSRSKVGVVTNSGSGWSGGTNPANSAYMEDPYLLDDGTGTLVRISNRALLLAENKEPDGQTHSGVVAVFTGSGNRDFSAAPTQVIDPGADGAWDETDVTSPTAILDDTEIVCLYEGRGDGNAGMVGRAVSPASLSLDFTKDTVPLIETKAGTPYEVSVVPDDIRLFTVDGTDVWVVTCHGQDAGDNYREIRFATLDRPRDWEPGSFVYLGVCSPLSVDTVMMTGDNQGMLVDGADLLLVDLVAKDDEQDDTLAAQQSNLDSLNDLTTGQGVTLTQLDGRIDTLEADKVTQADIDAGDATVISTLRGGAGADCDTFADVETYIDGFTATNGVIFGIFSDIGAALPLKADLVDGTVPAAQLPASLALGETSSAAYRGDRGKTAYDHSQATGNPHGTTAAQITGLPWPRTINLPISYLPPDADAQSSWGTSNLVGTTSVITGAYMRSGTANNESWTWNVMLDAGTWAIDLWFRAGTTGGIITVTLDGVSLGTVDTYNGSSTNNNRGTLSGITVAAAGRYPLVLTNPTKNASATNYQMLLHAITGRRTGA